MTLLRQHQIRVTRWSARNLFPWVDISVDKRIRKAFFCIVMKTWMVHENCASIHILLFSGNLARHTSYIMINKNSGFFPIKIAGMVLLFLRVKSRFAEPSSSWRCRFMNGLHKPAYFVTELDHCPSPLRKVPLPSVVAPF